MTDSHSEELAEELRQFQEEKEKIRTIIGQIGGASSAKRQKLVAVIFVFALLVLFVLDVARHLLKIPVPLPPLFSIEIGILLVSIKIIMMIQKQSRVEHFEFWILNSIEFRVDQMSNRLRSVENHLGINPKKRKKIRENQ